MEENEITTAPSENSPEEFNVDTNDNLSQIRDYAKGLKTDLETYKGTHQFVEENFGNLESAEVAKNLYSGFTAEEFNPAQFLETINQISPARAKTLVEGLSKQEAKALAEQEVEKLFGSKVSEDELNLFKQWKASGYGVGEDEDVPEAFKYDADGNPLSDEQIEFYKNQFKTLKDMQKQLSGRVDETKAQEQQAVEMERQQKLAQAIDSFDAGNLKILEPDFAKVGLNINDSDTPQERQEKETLREFIIGGVGRLFLKNPELARDYETALKFIENGEAPLARRYEPRIQKGILEITRNGKIAKMLSAILPDEQNSVRPEISTSTSQTPTGQATTREERIKSLTQSGILK